MILDLEVPAQHLDLMMVEKMTLLLLSLYLRDLAKHPNVQIQSEVSQQQHSSPPISQVMKP